MTPDPNSDSRRAFTLDTMPDDLRAGLLALADQFEADEQAEAGQGRPEYQAHPVPDPDADTLCQGHR